MGAPATQRNLAQVAQDGATVLGVGNGDQACGETGDGRMLEPSELLEEVIAFCPQGAGRSKVLITAGRRSRPSTPCGHHEPFERKNGFCHCPRCA